MATAGLRARASDASDVSGADLSRPEADRPSREELTSLESAWATGRMGSGRDGDDPDGGDLDGDGFDDFSAYVPRRRTVLPPSFLLLVAAGLLFVGWEAIVDLRWSLFGPGPDSVVDLGRPGEHHMEAARDGVRARVTGFAGDRRGYFGRWFTDYEVFVLQGLPVLVQRPKGPPALPNTAELVTAEGRLLRLDGAGRTGALGRLFSPVDRYSAVRDQFAVLGELPLAGPTWLLLDGDIPRGDASAVVPPIVVVLAAVGCAVAGLRTLWRRRSIRPDP